MEGMEQRNVLEYIKSGYRHQLSITGFHILDSNSGKKALLFTVTKGQKGLQLLGWASPLASDKYVFYFHFAEILYKEICSRVNYVTSPFKSKFPVTLM